MHSSQTLALMNYHLSEAFRIVAGIRPIVHITGRDGQTLIAVGFRGDHLVEAMKIEAFLIEKGESILHRSQFQHGWTSLVYQLKNKSNG